MDWSCIRFATYISSLHENGLSSKPRQQLRKSCTMNDSSTDLLKIASEALAGGPQNIGLLQDKDSAIKEYFFNILDINFTVPKRLGENWGLATSLFLEVTFDIPPTMHEFPFAILCERSDDGCRLGISLQKISKASENNGLLRPPEARFLLIPVSNQGRFRKEVLG